MKSSLNQTLLKNIQYFMLFLIGFMAMGNLSAQKVLSGPYLVEPGDTGVIIRWEMDAKGDYKTEFGKSKSNTNEVKLKLRGQKNGGFLYEAHLQNLNPGETYYYRLIDPIAVSWNTFKTFSEKQKKFTFVAMGDSRSNPEIFKKIMEETLAEKPAFIISMGDLVEQGGDYKEWHDFFFTVVKDVTCSVPLVSTLGDHEADGDDGELFRYFLREDEPVDKQWFSFDYGNTHIISLDYRHPEDKEMIDWFIKDITSSEKEWNIVMAHRGAYNLGGHRSEWGRGIWPALFSKYNVDLVFAGHSHIYERFLPVRQKEAVNAVTYITTGGAGAGLYQAVPNKSVMAVTESVNHFVVVNIDKNKLEAKAIRMDGSLLDKFTIVKSHKGYNKEYEDLVISQDKLNTITGFNSAISQDLSAIPVGHHSVKYEVGLKSYLAEKIPFTIKLYSESAGSYIMESVSDTLQSKEDKVLKFDIYRKKDVTISRWGEVSPALQLMMIFKEGARTDTIIGKPADYWP